MEWDFRNFIYDGNSHDSVLIYYEPEVGNCLWVLDPGDRDNPDLPELTKTGLKISNLSMIQQQPAPGNGLPESIFGKELPHTWCYYYQKADLARQFGEWQRIAILGDEAAKLKHSPNNPQEWIPFIEGYARVGRWQEAIQKTLDVRRINFRVNPRLCRLWDRVLLDSTIPEQYQGDYASMRTRLACDIP
jgi:hypothetical protein